MTFAENINRICSERGTTLTAVVKTVKGSSSFTTQINRGSLPKEHEMLEMAKILNCSVMDFFEDDSPSLGTTSSVGLNTLDEDEQEVIRMFRCLTNKERHKFMAQAYAYEESMLRKKE